MKIIMPIAGKGTRLRPHTHVTPKSLIRVAGKPIISYIIDQVLNIDFTEIIFIIGHHGDQIQNYLRQTYKFPMKFVRQTEYQGLGHAIDHAKDSFNIDDTALVLLGDIIFTADIPSVVESKNNQIGVMKVAEPQKFGIVTINQHDFVTSMVEKPEKPPSNWAIAGIYYFQSAYKLFDSISYIMSQKIQTRNEYQLTDAMIQMLEDGEKFKVFNVAEWYDCGEKESLLETNKIMLERYATNNKVPGSIITPPVFIGKDVTIENSIIGPNVSISEGSFVKNAIIKNSILGIETNVENFNLENSLIGDNASLAEAPREFNIGPDSEMVFAK